MWCGAAPLSSQGGSPDPGTGPSAGWLGKLAKPHQPDTLLRTLCNMKQLNWKRRTLQCVPAFLPHQHNLHAGKDECGQKKAFPRSLHLSVEIWEKGKACTS